MLGSKLQKVAIYSKDMVRLGRAKDFEINTKDMKITHLIFELEDKVAKELFGHSPRLRHTNGKVPIDLVESARDAIILKQAQKKLKGAVEKL